jgi:hydrogenase maturation protease
MSPRVLVAGVGNLLRRDDGFGIVVANRLAERTDLPPGVRVFESGIGGVGLVQELMDGYDALVVVDAVRRGGRPGTLYVLEPAVPDIRAWTPERRHAFLADLHQVEPSRALGLAAALGVLPPRIHIVGCEPAELDEAAIGLTPAVERAAGLAVKTVLRLLGSIDWGGSSDELRSFDKLRRNEIEEPFVVSLSNHRPEPVEGPAAARGVDAV